jgi:hypothetical protein
MKEKLRFLGLDVHAETIRRCDSGGASSAQSSVQQADFSVTGLLSEYIGDPASTDTKNSPARYPSRHTYRDTNRPTSFA